MAMTVPPRSNIGAFEQISQIYYGTDDGFARLYPLEEKQHDAAHIGGLYEIFARYQKFASGVAPSRRENIHLASVVGGLYGLNLIPLFQPREITFFDINPHAVAFFNLIRRVWIASASAEDFLGKLKGAEYDVHTEQDRVIRNCLAARQNGTLTDDRGQSARSLRSSWRYALDHFDLTRKLLSERPCDTRVDGMQSSSFRDFVANRENLWIYCSNVMLFSFFDLTFHYPQNAALFAAYFEQTEMLDLGNFGDGPITVHCRLPMSVAS
jgi:hypothetical protein